jgi:hypothetical protein
VPKGEQRRDGEEDGEAARWHPRRMLGVPKSELRDT